MFELMDADQEALAHAHRERQEIEALWKQEKDKLRATQRVREVWAICECRQTYKMCVGAWQRSGFCNDGFFFFSCLQKKLDLECRLEEEQLRSESDRVKLEKDKALLQTRVKQLQENSE